MIAQRRDDNEAEIVTALHERGHGWIAMDRMTGFDGIIVSKLTGNHIVEVKNPRRRWKLTQREEKRRAEIEAEGGVYNIIQWPSQALELAERDPFGISAAYVTREGRA